MTNFGETNSTMILSLVLYCVSGTLLTLLNKLSVMIFPYTNILLVIQNGMSVLLLMLISRCFPKTFGPLPLLNLTIIRLWMPLVVLFVIMLTSSLSSLTYVSVPTVIVMRNLTTIIVALLEYVLRSNKIPRLSSVTLLCMLFGSILYAKHDLTFSIPGYAILCVNIMATSIYQIYVKKVTDSFLFENIGSIGMSYYNNFISLPILLVFAGIKGELASDFDLEEILEMKTIFLITLSGLFGFSLSVSAFSLNKLISATSMMVANNVNKFVIIILSEIFVQSTLDTTAVIGAVSVLIFGWIYSQTIKSQSKKIIPIVLTMISIVLMYNITMIKSNDHSSTHSSDQKDVFVNRENLMNITEKILQGDVVYRSYLPTHEISQMDHHFLPGITIKHTTKLKLPKSCRKRTSSMWQICSSSRCKPYSERLHWNYPHKTNSGEKTGQFINRVLEIAWGSNPPSIDLYLRSGCHGIMEMKYLFESIELFWPRFLGSIIIVLDAGDEVILENLLPKIPTHHYVIAFEETPCAPGRILNQYSYLNLDRHSSADYIVTIDSDCIFHSPVTPDLIFYQGKIRLASSRTFQMESWRKSVDAMLGNGMYDGHYMVTQPVTFVLSTFSSFRQWFFQTKNKCYEDQLSRLSSDHYVWFCWMCHLGTYLERGNSSQNEYDKYWFHHLDDSTTEPMLRFAIHVSYEPNHFIQCHKSECYGKSVNEVIRQGLCRAFGSAIFRVCNDYPHLDYINNVTFTYAHEQIQPANRTVRINAMKSYLERLSNVTMIALMGEQKHNYIFSKYFF